MYLMHNAYVIIIVTCYVMVLMNYVSVRYNIVFEMCFLEYVINREGMKFDL